MANFFLSLEIAREAWRRAEMRSMEGALSTRSIPLGFIGSGDSLFFDVVEDLFDPEMILGSCVELEGEGGEVAELHLVGGIDGDEACGRSGWRRGPSAFSASVPMRLMVTFA